MTGSARVRSVSADGKNAVVETERKSACEGCHKGAEGCDACSLLGPNGKISCPAVNAAGASVGDTVKIESSSRRMLLYAALLFIVPVVAGIAGYLAAGAMGAGEGIRAASAGVCFVLSLLAAGIYSGIKERGGSDVVIVKILKRAADETPADEDCPDERK